MVAVHRLVAGGAARSASPTTAPSWVDGLTDRGEGEMTRGEAGPEPLVDIGARPLLRIAAPMAASSALTLLLTLNDTVILGHSGAAVVAAAVVATASYVVLSGTVAGFALAAQVMAARRIGAGLVVAVLVAPEGPAALAAVRAIETLLTLLYVITIAVTSAVVTVAAQRIGAGDPAGVRAAERAGWRLLSLPVLVVAIAGVVLTPTVVGWMVDDPLVAQLAADVALLAWAQAPLLLAGILGNAVNRAHGDSRIGLYASLVAEYAVFLPAGVLLLRFLDLGLAGVMIAHLVYWIAYIAMIAPRRHRRLLEAAPPTTVRLRRGGRKGSMTRVDEVAPGVHGPMESAGSRGRRPGTARVSPDGL